jgi:hypothetical protein
VIERLFPVNEEQDRARLSILLPLSCVGFWIPAVVILAPSQFFLPERIFEFVFVIVLIVWLAFVVRIWQHSIRILKRAKVREVSPGNFHLLQGVGLAMVGAKVFVKGEDWQFFFQWVVCMDVALATFYISYFLLAWSTLIRIPWSAITGFGLVVLSLGYATFDNPFRKLF